MKNAEWIIKQGVPFKKVKTIQHNPKENRWYEITVNGKVVDKIVSKLEPADVFRKWLDQEHKEPVLDDVERRYLAMVIKPFRNKVKYISKVPSQYFERAISYQDCYIYIEFNDLSYNMNFPIFREDTMYKGMRVGKKYTLEDLGL